MHKSAACLNMWLSCQMGGLTDGEAPFRIRDSRSETPPLEKYSSRVVHGECQPRGEKTAARGGSLHLQSGTLFGAEVPPWGGVRHAGKFQSESNSVLNLQLVTDESVCEKSNGWFGVEGGPQREIGK
jgi:hypothetical protein